MSKTKTIDVCITSCGIYKRTRTTPKLCSHTQADAHAHTHTHPNGDPKNGYTPQPKVYGEFFFLRFFPFGRRKINSNLFHPYFMAWQRMYQHFGAQIVHSVEICESIFWKLSAIMIGMKFEPLNWIVIGVFCEFFKIKSIFLPSFSCFPSRHMQINN